MQERFPKAKLISVKRSHLKKFWMYRRIANASILYIGPVVVTWRRSWLPQAAYSKGWDAHFRQTRKNDGDGSGE